MSESSHEYFARRAREEREIAGACPDAAVASTHRRMAELYERHAEELRVAADTGKR